MRISELICIHELIVQSKNVLCRIEWLGAIRMHRHVSEGLIGEEVRLSIQFGETLNAD